MSGTGDRSNRAFTYEKAAGGYAVKEGKNVVALVLSEILAVFFCQSANERREKAERRTGAQMRRPGRGARPAGDELN